MTDLDALTQTVFLELRNIYYGMQGIIALKDLEFLEDIENELVELTKKTKELSYNEVNISEHLEFVNGLINRLKAEDYDASKEDISSRIRELDSYLPRIY